MKASNFAMNIKNVHLQGACSLAPMAGVADSAFRQLCKSFGASMVTSEMISAKALCMGDKKTHELLAHTDAESPFAIQLFGDDPLIFRQAVPLICSYKPDIIDINMGCPAPKIAGNGAGSALMKNPELVYEIIKNVVEVSPVPVTVKMRTGFLESDKNGVEIAKMAQLAGAHCVCVHGRTRERMYTPPADLDMIAKVKAALDIPIIGNGDIYTPQDAEQMLKTTGVDHLMVGRGALGAPWIFAQINEYLSFGEVRTHLTQEQKYDCLLQQALIAVERKGQKRAMSEMRKHAAWYFKGQKGAAKLRGLSGKISTIDDLKALIDMALQLPPQE